MLGMSSVFAATFVVPGDDWLVQRADAIVSGTVVSSRVERGPGGLIETVYTIRIDETIKGLAPGVAEIDVRQVGGRLDGEVLQLSGAPSYEVGDRYLVFMRKVGEGWVTFDMILGKFAFGTNAAGESILVRDERIVDARAHARTLPEQARLTREFIPRVKEVVRQQAQGFAMNEINGGSTEDESEPGDVVLASAIAVGAWAGDARSSIEYALSTEPASGVTAGDDGESRVIRDDPLGQIPGTFGVDSSVLAVAIYGCRASECLDDENVIEGSAFATIGWSDVVLNDVSPSVRLSQSILNTILTHELGHTLGFRHSNRMKNDASDGDSAIICAEPHPCSEVAVMTSVVDEARNGQLTSWDQDAAAAVYGGGAANGHEAAEYVDDLYVQSQGSWHPARRKATAVEWRITGTACQSVSIIDHPESVVAEEGSRATLSVEATGSALEYRWFEGEAGDRSRPAGSGNPFVTPTLAAATSYWVLVSGACGVVESSVAKVDVTRPCPSDALCALSNRFIIRLRAVDHRTNRSGGGEPHPENDIFGYFSVPALTGDPENPEVFVKILDGRSVNGNFWVFYGGLTDLQYTLSVTDSETGEMRQYSKPGGSSAGGFDVGSGVAPESCSAEVEGRELSSVIPFQCRSEAGELCLEKGRFRVEIAASDHRSGKRGDGTVIRQNDVSATFAIPALTGDPSNPEVFVKVLDGRSVNGYFWVFYSGLTDLEYTVVVSDSQTGFRKAYTKSPGSACGAFDTSAY
jgi:hypothetical protein